MLLTDTPNELAEALNDALDGEWYIESESNTVARAYSHDIREDPPEREVVSVELRSDREYPYSVSTTAFNERRGMGDLYDHGTFDALEDALDAAERMADDVRHDA